MSNYLYRKLLELHELADAAYVDASRSPGVGIGQLKALSRLTDTTAELVDLVASEETSTPLFAGDQAGESQR